MLPSFCGAAPKKRARRKAAQAARSWALSRSSSAMQSASLDHWGLAASSWCRRACYLQAGGV